MAKRKSRYNSVIELILLVGATLFVLLLSGVDLGLIA